MKWLLNVLLAGLFLLAFEVVIDLAMEFLRPLRRLYAPPHGATILFVTWTAAVALLPVAWYLGPDHPGISVALFVAPVPLALIATLTHRDLRREASGEDPVRHYVPKHLGPIARASCGIAGVGLLALAVVTLRTQAFGMPGGAIAGMVLFGTWLTYSGVAGHFPRTMSQVLGLKEL